MNFGRDAFVVQRGDRVAQTVVVAVPSVEFVRADALESTERGEGGFGSTGI